MNETILIIDDEADLRENLSVLLQFEGFTIIEAAGGVAGIEQARTHTPDLIICDIMMPGTDGFAVLKQLRQTPETARIPVILLTAKTERAARQRGEDLGAVAFIKKPFTSDNIAEAIRRILG